MAPYSNIPLSPAELSYLYTSLAQTPPIRPDGRTATQFRPLVAETEILPSANGSARICFADGTEAVAGVKAEVEKSRRAGARAEEPLRAETGDAHMDDVDADGDDSQPKNAGKGEDSWLEIAIEIPGMRDDDALPIFLSAMLTEALLADGELKDRLWINTRYHWRLYIDILLLSQPLSYPLPLLSLTTHLALLSTRLPSLISEKDEDPLFNDDWEASLWLYPRDHPTPAKTQQQAPKPPITLLVISVKDTILFDPSTDELAVADSVLAISAVVSTTAATTTGQDRRPLRIVALRTIDPPSRLTSAGVPNTLNTTAGGSSLSPAEALAAREKDEGRSVWRPPRGGVKRGLVGRMVERVVEEGGVGMEVLEGLVGFGGR